MIHQADAPAQSSLRLLSVLVFHLLLSHCCKGQSQLVGPPQPIVATVGDDIILPCHLKPAKDVTAEILEWKRSDLKPIFVLVWRDSQDLTTEKNPSYKGRTSVFIDELKQGNISLKLLKVQLSDQGTYECDIPLLDKKSSVQLVVGAASSPVLTLAGVDKTTRGVVLQCESPGWYPEPEVLWLDGEGNVLSAGPTETVRGPDDLYTVSSRVTVEKRHSNSFSCRVQQKNINQTRETTIHVPDEFFQLQSSCGVPIITALSVSLAVCILIILFLLFFVWKQKQNKNKTNSVETEKAEKKKSCETNRTADQFVPEEERGRLMGAETLQMEGLKGEEEKKIKHLEDKEQVNLQWKQTNEELKEAKVQLKSKDEEISQLKRDFEKKLNDEKIKREEAEKEVKILKDKEAELEKKLQDERNKREEEVKTLKKELETKVELLQQQLHDEKIKREEAEKDLEELEKKLQDEKNKREKADEEVKTQKKELENKVVLLQQQLHDEKIKREKADEQVKNLKEKETELNKQLWFNREKEKKAEKDLKELEKKLQDEKNKMERAEKEVKNLKKELETKVVLLQQQLHDEKIKREEAEKEVKILKDQETKLEKKLQDERIKRERAEKNNEPSGQGPTEEETTK